MAVEQLESRLVAPLRQATNPDPVQTEAETGDIAVALLEELVRIPSPTGETQEAAEALVAWGREQGLYGGLTPTGSPWLSTAPKPFGALPGRHVLLYGHLDTVPGHIHVRVEPSPAGPVLWGRGTVDAKAPLSTFASVVSSLAHDKALLGNTTLTVIGAVDEEGDSETAFWLLDHIVRAPDVVLIGEPSGAHAITLGYKGRLLLEASVTRRVTHGGFPEDSAADALVTMLARFRRELDDAIAARDGDGLFAHETMKIRTLTTEGDGLNETATAFVDVRLPPGEDPIDFAALVGQAPERPEVAVIDSIPAHVATRHSPLVQAFNAALREEKVRPRHLYKTGTSDMNLLAPRWPGSWFLVYGPGDAHLDHTPFERIPLSELRTGVRILERALTTTLTEFRAPGRPGQTA